MSVEHKQYFWVRKVNVELSNFGGHVRKIINIAIQTESCVDMNQTNCEGDGFD